MKKSKNIFLRKKILIYGLGKSGISTYKFLKGKSELYLYDDNLKINLNFDKKLITPQEIRKLNIDIVIISPGINIFKCKLSKFLKKNLLKIYTDLDIFYSFYDNKSVTITGTNGKSTTAKILYDVLLDQKKDVRLIGNIGNPVLNEKKITKKTFFVIEASSYQLDYSRIFSTKYSIILNISPDHIERHGSLKNYINAKFKLLDLQSKNCFAYIKKDDKYINRKIKSKKFDCKIIKVNTKKITSNFKSINNSFFSTEQNRENLSFVFEISKKLKLKNHIFLKTIQNFKGLKYRQQVIYKKNNLIIINDSKSTSFSSTVGILKNSKNVFWLLGGIYKKGDKFNLKKDDLKDSNINAFVYGKNKSFFNKELQNKIKYKNFNNLSDALKKVFNLISKDEFKHNTILFSPCAASFDSFKNFEDRGSYFNKLVRKYINDK